MDAHWIQTLYTLLERNEIDKTLLQPEEIECIKKAVALLGYKLTPWYDAKTLVISCAQETESAITEYEVAALDILSNVASNCGGVCAASLQSCTITADLIRKGWLLVEGGRVNLTKRAKVEKAQILSEATGTKQCSFCQILNSEGNVPHEECLKYIAE
ncbi:uncharacterized protein NEMAJ01_1476 [Nematocida major]|uniref:uncharacterized protein n=1 Tax=Nematocida major TaxID=1912982 RepID=UPI0020088819|nr:uncharacterized protein NEMAJ01_1476 [Nematocida major]KAH9386580.1 hypothetical protein NEMAJ01_1476 [Nematocida major]